MFIIDKRQKKSSVCADFSDSFEPDGGFGVGGHLPASAGGEGYGADAGGFGRAATFELLAEKAADEGFKPTADFGGRAGAAVFFGEGGLRQRKDFFGGEAEAHGVIQKEVVKFIGTDKGFSFLNNFSVFWQNWISTMRRSSILFLWGSAKKPIFVLP